MDFNEYQALAQRTSNKKLSQMEQIRNGCYGLCGEAGECIDILKKHEFQDHPLNVDKLIDEAGDLLWYLAQLAAGLGVPLEEFAQHNIAKLRARYPKGFDSERSINREE